MFRRIAYSAYSAVIFIGAVPIIGFIAACSLPSLICQRMRAVRYVPIVGTCYYGALVSVAVWIGLARWAVCLLAAFALLQGDWLPPNPIAFFFSPVRRRAAIRAIEYFEAQGGPRPSYLATIIGIEPGRIIVRVETDEPIAPPRSHYLAIATDGRVELLDSENVEAAYGIRPTY